VGAYAPGLHEAPTSGQFSLATTCWASPRPIIGQDNNKDEGKKQEKERASSNNNNNKNNNNSNSNSNSNSDSDSVLSGVQA